MKVCVSSIITDTRMKNVNQKVVEYKTRVEMYLKSNNTETWIKCSSVEHTHRTDLYTCGYNNLLTYNLEAGM